MLYLIGGPARCGKSTLSKEVAIRTGSQLLHTDFIRPAMESVASGEDLAALRLRPKESEYTPDQWIEQLRIRDAVIWRGIKKIIDSVIQHGDDIVVEGVIWPDYAAEVADQYSLKAAFIVDTHLDDHATRITQLAAADDTDNNWMKNWDQDRLTNWAAYNVARSQRVAELAVEHCFPVYDIADGGISHAQDRALQYLIS